MKSGMSLVELATEIERQKDQKVDYIADTSALDVVVADDRPKLQVGDNLLDITPVAHGQIAGHTKIHKAYYDRMVREAPDLLATNVGHWFRKHPAPRMVRTLDNQNRAFLSNSYRALENEDLAEAVLPALQQHNMMILSSHISETRLYIKAVCRDIEKDVPTGRKMGDGTHTIFDTVCPAITIFNSEVGLGSLGIECGIYTQACTNLATFGGHGIRKTHLGRRQELADGMSHMLTDHTKKLDDAALWSTVRDVVAGSLNELEFGKRVDALAETSERKFDDDPIKVIDRTSERFSWTEDERGSVLTHLISGGDLSQYGLHAAITRTAEDLSDYDRATQFERQGGQIVELKSTEWRALAEAA